MTPAGMVLVQGAKHSSRNAELIRAWALETKPSNAALQALVEDWRERGFLSPSDATVLKAKGGAS